MRTSELDTWAFVSGFTHSVTGDTEEETGHFIPTALDIHFEPPEAISIPLDNGAEARVEFRFEQSGMTWVTTEMRLSQSASLHLRYATPARLEELTTSVTQLRNLLSLAIGRPLSLLSVKGFRDDLVLQNSSTRKPVEIYWQVPHNPEPLGRPLLPQEMLFTLPEASPSISDVMRGWFAHQSVLRPFFNLYFGTLYHPDLFLDQRFLGYIRAVETYDRLRRDTTERPRAEHKTLLKTLAAAVPEEHRSWLKSKLAWSNELTLRRRLVDVLAGCPNVASRLIGSDDQIDAFARMAVDTRNYHTHYDPALEAKAANGAELYQLTVQLRGIIEMSLLRELGFPCDAIDAILERVQRYQEVEHFKAIASAARASREGAAGG